MGAVSVPAVPGYPAGGNPAAAPVVNRLPTSPDAAMLACCSGVAETGTLLLVLMERYRRQPRYSKILAVELLFGGKLSNWNYSHSSLSNGTWPL